MKIVTTTHLTASEIRVMWALGQFTKAWSKRGGLTAMEIAQVTELYLSDIWSALSFLDRCGYICVAQTGGLQPRYYQTELGASLRIR